MADAAEGMTVSQAVDALRAWRDARKEPGIVPISTMREMEAAVEALTAIFPPMREDFWYTRLTHISITSHATDGGEHRNEIAGEITLSFEERTVDGHDEMRGVVTTEWRRKNA